MKGDIIKKEVDELQKLTQLIKKKLAEIIIF